MKRILNHWCLYYVWVLKYFQRKNKKGAYDISRNLIITPILIYLMLYLIVPALFMSKSKDKNFLSENYFVLILIGTIFVSIASGFILNSKYIKQKVTELESIENWENSLLYKKGRRIFIFHIVFTFLSVPISMLFGVLILKNI